MAFTLGAFLYNLDPLPDDMYIAYLPLAHVLELLGESMCVAWGCTIGSTGTPKGVVLTHGNMAFTLGAFLYNLDPLPGDMYIAYLPLAHVLELLGESMCVAW